MVYSTNFSTLRGSGDAANLDFTGRDDNILTDERTAQVITGPDSS